MRKMEENKMTCIYWISYDEAWNNNNHNNNKNNNKNDDNKNNNNNDDNKNNNNNDDNKNNNTNQTKEMKKKENNKWENELTMSSLTAFSQLSRYDASEYSLVVTWFPRAAVT